MKYRPDTLIGEIEKKYGIQIGFKSDEKLFNFLKRTGAPSLAKLLKMTRPKKKNKTK